jgi:hypothetical protein
MEGKACMNQPHSVLKRRIKSNYLHRLFAETNPLKKTVIELLIAVVLGVATTIVPLMVIAETRNQNQADLFLFDDVHARAQQPQGYYDLVSSKSSTSGFEVLIVSFVVAMIVYLYVRHRMPSRPLVWVRFPPY